jgi:hypothetical protein
MAQASGYFWPFAASESVSSTRSKALFGLAASLAVQ